MTVFRWIRLLWLPGVMLGVAGFLAWYGAALLVHQSSPWLGWIFLAAAVLKAGLWLYVARLRIRFHDTHVLAHLATARQSRRG